MNCSYNYACSTYVYHVGECQGSVSCGGMKRLHTEAAQQLRNCNEWNSLAIISVISKSCCSTFMHTGIALCFHTPYNSGFLLIPASTCSHQTYIYSSHLILVSLFSAVNQTLSRTKVSVMWWLSTVLVTATWKSSFIAIQVQECNLGENIADACTILWVIIHVIFSTVGCLRLDSCLHIGPH